MKKYVTRVYTSGICRYEDKYLLLRISRSYEICPGDWEWLTCSVKMERIGNLKDRLLRNVSSTLKLHTGLEGKILKIYPPFIWDDHEFKLTYIIYPILIEVESPSVNLVKKKFSEFKWITWENILNFDRNNYLSDYFNHIKYWEKII